jgi:hypothetical protein
VDITAVVELNETPAVTAAVAVDETNLQATVNSSLPTTSDSLVRIAVAGSTVYTGRAPVGTAESAVGWTIKRRTFNAAGVLQATAIASGAWTNRASLTYS